MNETKKKEHILLLVRVMTTALAGWLTGRHNQSGGIYKIIIIKHMHNYTQHAMLRLSGFCGGSELWWHILLQLHRQLICFAIMKVEEILNQQ